MTNPFRVAADHRGKMAVTLTPTARAAQGRDKLPAAAKYFGKAGLITAAAFYLSLARASG
jgi:hypothetical protein